ncbi:hypothetical protein GCM10017673_37910 [Streptosporangium violaceochromogenes]|nr:hypothetical protein GCM10017673_37910 [Streptosporangium violaceochromogenes]
MLPQELPPILEDNAVNDLVTCTLAHPLPAEGARSVGLEFRDHEVEETITLMRGHALRLVGAGLIAGADPRNPQSVNDALRPAQPPAAPADAPDTSPGKTARVKPTTVGDPA